MSVTIQFRRDTSANWASVDPVLAQGELGLELDTTRYKIGDGLLAWTALPYGELSGQVGGLSFTNQGAVAVPATPTGAVAMFGRQIAGRVMPAFVGPSGIDSALQPLLARNKVGVWMPPGNATTVPGVFGHTALTAVGTANGRNITTANLFTRMRRIGYISAATAGSLASARVSVAQVTLGTGTLGGFTSIRRFGISDVAAVAGARMFMGMRSVTTAPTNVEPSTLTNGFGVGHDAAHTNLHFFYGGSVAQPPIDLGASFPITHGSAHPYELALFSPTGVLGRLYWQVTRLDTGDAASGEINDTTGVQLPLSTTLLTYFVGWRSNNATALAVGLDIMSNYIETDF